MRSVEIILGELSPSKKLRVAASVTFYLCLSVYLVALLKTLQEEHNGGFSTIKSLNVGHVIRD